MPSIAENAIGDDADGQLGVGIGQDEQWILCPALGLHPLAVRRSAAINVASDRRGTDKGDCLNQGMVEDCVDGIWSPVNQIDHACWKPNLL
ncbi:MAG: hypothetical protein BWY63_03886 [Chloroflexi bacterium ADurb.Bin360]|nr:MAG: hypothetical protein BWY63_03886 [Chloroflexi bacterium ADurb.Bin360]